MKIKRLIQNVLNKDGILTDEDIIKRKRLMAFAVLLGLILLILSYSYYAFIQKQKRLTAGQRVMRTESLLSDSEKKADWQARMESEFDLLKKENEQLKLQLGGLHDNWTEVTEKQLSEDDIERLIQENTPQPQPQQDKNNKVEVATEAVEKKKEAGKKVDLNLLPEPPKPSAYTNLSPGGLYNYAALGNKATKQEKEEDPGLYVYKPEKAAEDNETDDSFYIPAGSFVRGVLLTGVDAPTMQSGDSNPQPVLLNLNKDAILPNSYRSNMIDCIAIGSARGDLSAERVYIRMVNISCVEKSTARKVVDTEVSGWVIGEDGKVGVRGRLVSKQGSILAKALVAGFAQGVSDAFSTSANNVITTSEGTVTSIDPDQTFKAAGFKGAMEKLADFYMNMAESMFPVIEVGAGRNITIVVKDGKDYVLEPKNIQDNPLYKNVQKEAK
jgi:conjugal transfer pilus assembly protein TraB